MNYNSGVLVPLSAGQKGIYYECLQHPAFTMYNNPYALKLPPAVDLARFEEAVLTVAQLHPALKVKVVLDDDQLFMQEISDEIAITKYTYESLEEATRTFVRPFDLSMGPLYRFALYTTAEGTFFCWDIHHLVIDGLSIKIFLEQIVDAYQEREVSPEQESFFTSVQEEQSPAARERYGQAKKFFAQYFTGIDFATSLLPDVASADKLSGSAEIITEVPLSHEKVKNFTQKIGIKEVSFFTAAFAYALACFTGADCSSFSTASNGRSRKEQKHTSGMFVKLLPLYFDLSSHSTVEGFLHYVHDLFFATIKHNAMPFGELVRDYGVNTDISFTYLGKLISEVTLEGSSVMPVELPVNSCQAKLLCMVTKTCVGYEIRMHYRPGLFSEALITNLSHCMFSVMQGFLEQRELCAITLVTPQQQSYLDKLNATEVPYDFTLTVNALLERSIAAYREQKALSYKEKSYTYGEFNRITLKLAAYLRQQNIGPEQFVAVLSPRNDEAVLAAWGVIRAGAIYQPLDPSYPPERLNYMLTDSKAALLLVARELAPLVEQHRGKVLYTDEIFSLPENSSFTATNKPEQGLALLYTSGTTGKPKGIILENRNLVAFTQHHLKNMGINSASHVASYASFGFDAGLMDIITTPLAGACLYIIPDNIRMDMGHLQEFFIGNAITHTFMTTQVGRAFAGEVKCETLSTLLLGGEKLVPFVPPANLRILNGYGPCETMAYVCSHAIENNSALQPIGKANANTKFYILDKKGRLLPPGACGELAIASRQVGRGYLGLAAKTAEVFVTLFH